LCLSVSVLVGGWGISLWRGWGRSLWEAGGTSLWEVGLWLCRQDSETGGGIVSWSGYSQSEYTSVSFSVGKSVEYSLSDGSESEVEEEALIGGRFLSCVSPQIDVDVVSGDYSPGSVGGHSRC
jgi:hypothetical protein